MLKIVKKLFAFIFKLGFLKSLWFRLSDLMASNVSYHSRQHLDLNAVVFQSYDVFEQFIKKVFFPEHKNILFNLKPFFLNLIGIYSREAKSPLQLHKDLVSLLLGNESKIGKKFSIPDVVTSDPVKRKKILFVSNMFPSVLHGGGLRIFDIIFHLSKDHDIYLLSSFFPENDKESFSYIKDKLKGHFFFHIGDIKVEYFRKWVKQNPNEIKDFDAIFLEYHKSLDLLETLRPYGKRIIFTYMECLSLSYYLRFVQTENWSKRYFADDLELFIRYALLEKYALEVCDEAIAVTDHDADFIAKFSPLRPKVINHCVSDFSIWNRLETAKFTPINNSVLFLGNFFHPPNVDGIFWYIQNVHPIVKRYIPDYKLLVVGAGKIENLAEKCKDDASIKFTGYVEDIVPEILSSTICISPLISGAGLRGKVNQYSACKKASVNTSIGLKGLPYTHNKDTLMADTPDDFAKGVVKLLSDADFRIFIQTHAYKIAKEHFSWESKIREIESLIS
ncbi:hypothetical protein LPTSP4_02910 [Leptospira ryugenii]|uniref:Glycosyltransferase n=1 Tax=Leptospira ryugenii TaxID=1917863 RepID=A0A2P2DVX8_9LEPT|nr:glycosyltransferase family 4 protein [Leptospira ryugenii]GBF48791.1 hypothetical protein LPTSP4_02910 [Leptospira ryugenii]